MDTKSNVPTISTPFIDKNGQMNVVWFQFFLKMFARTGGGGGVDGLRDHNRSVSNQALGVEASPMDLSAQNMVRLLTSWQEVNSHGKQYDESLHALVTTTLAGFMSAADKVKLDALVPFIQPVNIIGPVTVVNSTVDTNVVTLTVPASTFTAASAFNLKLGALMSSAAAAGTLSIWVKLNATKILTNTFTLPAGAVSGRAISYAGTMTIRSLGVGGVLKVFATAESDGNVLTGSPVVTSDAGPTIDTTVSNTLTIGMNWSVANAGNTITATQASIIQEK